MKKYIYIFAFLGLSLCSQSCMDKLEILPSDQIITDNFFEKGKAWSEIAEMNADIFSFTGGERGQRIQFGGAAVFILFSKPNLIPS